MVTHIGERFALGVAFDFFAYIMFFIFVNAWPKVTNAPVTDRQKKFLNFLLVFMSAGLVLPSLFLALSIWVFGLQLSALVVILFACIWGVASYRIIYK